MSYPKDIIDINRRFAGFETTLQPTATELSLFGTQLEVIVDDELAASFESGEHLLPWMGDEQLLVDRYDARLLLDDISTVSARSKSRMPSTHYLEADEVTEQELDEERYADLSTDLLDATAVDQGTWLPASAEPARIEQPGEYNSVGFSYVTEADDIQSNNDENDCASETMQQTAPEQPASREEDAPFYPKFAIPDDIPTLPKTDRQHKIIAQTAKFLRAAGPQMEIVLRVKQGDHPNFTFLMPADPLHPYFRWVLKHNPTELVANAAPDSETDVQQTVASVAPESETDVQQPTIEPTGTPPLQFTDENSAGVNINGLALISAYDSQDVDTDTPRSSVAATDTSPDLTISSPARAISDDMLVEDSQPLDVLHAPAFTQPSFPAEQPDVPGSPEPGVPGIDEQVEPEVAPEYSAPVPPEDIKGIIAKLVLFVKKHGAKFESVVREKEKTNAKFTFLLPWNQYHQYYNDQLLDVLGEEAAQQVFDLRGQTNVEAPAAITSTPEQAESSDKKVTETDQNKQQVQGDVVLPKETSHRSFIGPVHQVTLKVNPTLVQVRKLKPTQQTETDPSTGDAAPLVEGQGSGQGAGAAKEESGKGADKGLEQGAQAAVVKDTAVDQHGADTCDTAAPGAGDDSQLKPKPKTELTEEMKAAIRRKLARKLLEQKRQAGVASVSQPVSKVAAIAHHRQALLRETEELLGEQESQQQQEAAQEMEPGEIVDHEHPSQDPSQQQAVLPTLQDIIGPVVSLSKHREAAFNFADAPVLQVYKPPVSPINAAPGRQRGDSPGSASSGSDDSAATSSDSSESEQYRKRSKRSHKTHSTGSDSSESEGDRTRAKRHKRHRSTEGRSRKSHKRREKDVRRSKHKRAEAKGSRRWKKRRRDEEDEESEKHRSSLKERRHQKSRHADGGRGEATRKAKRHKSRREHDKERHKKARKHASSGRHSDSEPRRHMSQPDSSSNDSDSSNGGKAVQQQVDVSEVPQALRAKVRALLQLG